MSSSRPDSSEVTPTGSKLPKALGLVIVVVLLVAVGSSVLGRGGSDSSSASAQIVASSDPITSDSGTSGGPIPTWPGPNSSATESATPTKNSETGAAGASGEPCALVTKSEAAAIMGEEVGMSEGDLGPTCIFASGDEKKQVTLVVEPVSLASLRKSARGASPVDLGGQTGWCLRFDSTSVAVSLSSGQILSVTGPCSTASQFAAAALGRLE